MSIRHRRASVIFFALLMALAMPTFASDADQAKKDSSEDTGMLGTNSGAQTYEKICQGCHMPDGRGAVGAGAYPAFAGSPTVASSRYLAVTILNGRRNMPAFAKPSGQGFWFQSTWLTDKQIADVVNYIRTSFGNDYNDPITAAEVAALQPPAGEKK
jgi:mono/diheme cytochrome c family protein